MEFTSGEEGFLELSDAARIATSHKDIPHVKPVSFVYHNKAIFVATDYNTRTFRNLEKNPNVAISVDTYKPGAHKAIVVQGNVEIIDSGEEFRKIYNMFEARFAWVRKDPWKEKEAPFLKIIATNKTSWGLG